MFIELQEPVNLDDLGFTTEAFYVSPKIDEIPSIIRKIIYPGIFLHRLLLQRSRSRCGSDWSAFCNTRRESPATLLKYRQETLSLVCQPNHFFLAFFSFRPHTFKSETKFGDVAKPHRNLFCLSYPAYAHT